MYVASHLALLPKGKKTFLASLPSWLLPSYGLNSNQPYKVYQALFENQIL